MKQKQDLPKMSISYSIAEAALKNNLAETIEKLNAIERSMPLSLSDKILLSISGTCSGAAYYFFAELLAKLIRS